MAQVNSTVNGRVYRMACEDGEEDHVATLGARFDAAVDELRSALGEIGDQRLMVMAGILMTDRLKRAEQDIRDLKDSRTNAAMRIDGMEERFAESLENAAVRIERIAQRLQAEPDPADDLPG